MSNVDGDNSRLWCSGSLFFYGDSNSDSDANDSAVYRVVDDGVRRGSEVRTVIQCSLVVTNWVLMVMSVMAVYSIVVATVACRCPLAHYGLCNEPRQDLHGIIFSSKVSGD